MKQNVESAYKLRFGKVEGVDTWIAGVAAKPFPNPTSPITPVSDPETSTGAVTTVTAPVVTAPAKPAPVKPAPAKAAPTKTAAATNGKPATAAKLPAGKATAKKKGV